MSLRHALFSLCLIVLLGAPSIAAAQSSEPVIDDALGVTITPPEGWKRVKLPGSEKSLASFRHAGSQSQIEVIGTKLINEDVAEVFFETFAQSLVGTGFSESVATAETKIGEISGKKTEYSYAHTGIKLRVVVFTFLREDAAYMAIGYFKEEERDAYFSALEATVEALKFS